MYDLSILIPARNEQFLSRTVEDILSNIRGNTEIIVVLDGVWAEPVLQDHPQLTIIHHTESIGQRAATNEAARLSTARYLMKVDAHCSFDEGFDVKLMADMQDDWTVAPLMKNLHAFDWVCPKGHRRYQGPSGPCKDCGEPTTQDVVWIAKQSPQSTSYRFDQNLHFQYFGEYKARQHGDLVESMSLQGSCFMMTRKKYWELGICDEAHGSWGQQGTEVACKTWLSGSKVIINKKTWYAHMFRTQGGDFGFPYPLSGREVSKARGYSKRLFVEGQWKKAKHPLSWLIEKFSPVPGWPTSSKGIIYYTDNQLELRIAHKVQAKLKSIGLPIVSVSLKPMPHFGTNIHQPLKRGVETMYRQIISALEVSTAEIVFFCEHDVLYHPSHFEFTPTKRDVFYYNHNVWKLRVEDGLALWVNNCRQVSGLCGFREEILKHYRERLKFVKEDSGMAHKIGYEPGTRQDWVDQSGRRYEFVNKYTDEKWMSFFPNIDIRHSHNLTKNRWHPSQFHNKSSTEGWTEANEIPGWGKTNLLGLRKKIYEQTIITSAGA